MISKLSTIKTLIETLPLFEKVIFHVANIMGQRERFYLSIYGPGSWEIKILKGAFEMRKGEQVQMELHCTYKAFAVIQKSLMKQSVQLQTRLLVSK
jgi:hypothetical protein